MIDIFTPGTAQLKRQILKSDFNAEHFFCKLLALAPGLKIREWCKNGSNEEAIYCNEILYKEFKNRLKEKCQNIEQIMELSIFLCQNYDFHSYYKSLYLDEPKSTDFLNSKFKPYYRSYIEQLDSNLKNFQTELKYFLFLSGLYTYSLSPSISKTLPQSIQSLYSNANMEHATAKSLANSFTKQAHSFYTDGLSITKNPSFPKTTYIGECAYPDFFQSKNGHKKINSMYDIPILTGFIRRKDNLFYKCLKFNKFNLSWLTIQNFLNNFVIYPPTQPSDFDTHAMTDYLLERISNFNFFYAIPVLYVQMLDYLFHIFKQEESATLEDIDEKIFCDMLSFLPFYPLPRQRLLLLQFISNKICLAPINFSFAHLNGFFYQTFIYFPLIDITFTYLLRLYHTQKDIKLNSSSIIKNIFESLKDEFNSQKYTEYFHHYRNFILDQETYHMFNTASLLPSFSKYLQPGNTEQTSFHKKDNNEIIWIDFTRQIKEYAFNESGPFKNYWTQLTNFNFDSMMNSFNHAGFSDIKKMNQHIMTAYDLSEFNYIPISFMFLFINELDARALTKDE